MFAPSAVSVTGRPAQSTGGFAVALTTGRGLTITGLTTFVVQGTSLKVVRETLNVP